MKETESPGFLEARLLLVLSELEKQSDVSNSYPPDRLSFADEMKQIHEFIEIAVEYGLAYECLVAVIQFHPFTLSGKAVIALLELGLLFGYKSEMKEDAPFDRR